MTGFNTVGDPRNQLAQLMAQPTPVQVPRNHSPYIANPAQQAQGGAGSPLASPLIGGGLQMLGKGSAAKPQQLWPGGLNAADSKRFFDLTNGNSASGITWNPQNLGYGADFGFDPSMFEGGSWLGGGGGAGMLGAGGADAGLFEGGAWLGGGGAAALGGEAALGGIGAAGGAEGLAAVIAANPELLLLLAA